MGLMRIYLDMCCFNRPYDDQTQARIRLEAEAKLLLQEKVKAGECSLLWSSTLDFECAQNPYEEHRLAIANWRAAAERVVMATEDVVAKARELALQGIGNYDALHVASAIVGQADLLATTDDRLLKRMRGNADLAVVLPADALAVLENWYED